MERCRYIRHTPALERSGHGQDKKHKGKNHHFPFVSLRNLLVVPLSLFFYKEEWPSAGNDESAVTHQTGEPSLRVSALNLCASLKSINACDVITFYKDTGDKLNFYTVRP